MHAAGPISQRGSGGGAGAELTRLGQQSWTRLQHLPAPGFASEDFSGAALSATLHSPRNCAVTWTGTDLFWKELQIQRPGNICFSYESRPI